MGGASESGASYSLSFNNESQSSKRMRMDNFASSQIGDDDDDIAIISAT